MRVLHWIGLVAAMVLLPTTSPAQETGGGEGEGAGMEMPEPAPEMKKMDWMIGRWSVDETHEKSQWGPGGTGEGAMEVERGPGGFSHVFTYESTGPMGSFSGHGMTAWDPQAKVYRTSWTDNMTPGLMISECREEGNDIVCTSESSMAGPPMTMRTRAINPNPEGWTEVFEVSTDGGPYQKMMTLEYEPAP